MQTLPTARDTLVLTDSFSRGYDPYTHVCRARPLSTDGWTSLSVIVIVIDVRDNIIEKQGLLLSVECCANIFLG